MSDKGKENNKKGEGKKRCRGEDKGGRERKGERDNEERQRVLEGDSGRDRRRKGDRGEYIRVTRRPQIEVTVPGQIVSSAMAQHSLNGIRSPERDQAAVTSRLQSSNCWVSLLSCHWLLGPQRS